MGGEGGDGSLGGGLDSFVAASFSLSSFSSSSFTPVLSFVSIFFCFILISSINLAY